MGDLPGFVRRFMKEQLMYDPFFSHLEEAWGHRDNENLLFIWFEEMKTDLRDGIGQWKIMNISILSVLLSINFVFTQH